MHKKYSPSYERELQDYVAWLQRGVEFTGNTPEGQETNATAPKIPPRIADAYSHHILCDFCERARTGHKQNAAVLSWITDVLDNIIDAGKPEARKAFSLLPRREGGRSSADEHFDIACWVALTIERGYEPADACQLASVAFHKDVKSIRRLCRSKGNKVLEMNERALEEYFKLDKGTRRPLPDRIKKGTGTR